MYIVQCWLKLLTNDAASEKKTVHTTHIVIFGGYYLTPKINKLYIVLPSYGELKFLINKLNRRLKISMGSNSQPPAIPALNK